MMRHLVAASFVFTLACSSSSSSPGGGGPDGSTPGSGNLTSSIEERRAMCDDVVPKCGVYDGEPGNCVVDHTSVASCYVRSVHECVKHYDKCSSENFDACMKEGGLACDAAPNPPYVAQCKDRNTACKSEYDDDERIEVDDACMLLRAMDDYGRQQGAACVAGPCNRLAKCLNELTP